MSTFKQRRIAPRALMFLGAMLVALAARANSPPNTPAITEPNINGKIVSPADVHMETAPFSDPDAGQTHLASDWEIWTTAPTPERVWFASGVTSLEKIHIHLGDGAFTGSLAGSDELIGAANYKLRVRHEDNSGASATQWSAWAERLFQTAPSSQTFPLSISDVAASPAPTLTVALPAGASLELGSAAGELLLRIQGAGNIVTNPGDLANHVAARIKMSAGGTGLILPVSELAFSDDDGSAHSIYLPAFNIPAGQSVYCWVALNGATFAGNASQTAPDFSTLLRGAPVPWTVLEPGYKVEVVATGFQLPVNIAFVPNAGSQPNSPFYYVTELYGTIKVVTRDGGVHDYAANLLNYDPTGPFAGSGEQGLTGIAIDPVTGDVFASMLYSAIPFDNGSFHYPKVVRFHSTDGGLTAASATTIRDMAGETQGQSHQVSNVTIGPDGKLYVHNGDGFDIASAQDLNSYRGKILRMNLDGTAPADNPFYNATNGITATDYIFASGMRNPFGGTWRASDGAHYEVENGPSVDRFAKIVAGRNYLWDGTDDSMENYALYIWNQSHAPVNVAFIQPSTFGGSGFPAEKSGHAFVSESGPTWASGTQTLGKQITEFVLDSGGSLVSGPVPLVQYNGSGKATVAGLTAGPDGLYFTDLYKDQNYATAVDRGANILRISFAGLADFTAVPILGEPPLLVQFVNDSTVPSPTGWTWDFGDNTTSSQESPSHVYASAGSYDVRLVVTNSNGQVVAQKNDFIQVGAIHGLRGDYFGGIDFAIPLLMRLDNTVNFDWGQGGPDSLVGSDNFSVRWTGKIQPQFSETYTFHTVSDDGARLWVNGQLIVNDWNDHGATENSGTIALTAGQKYDLKMEYYEHGVAAVARLLWSSPTLAKQVVPASVLTPDFGAAGFTLAPSSGTAPLSVQFTDTSTLISPLTWAWNFGDGQTSSLQNAAHLYTTPGTYSVGLTIAGLTASKSVQQTGVITVSTSFQSWRQWKFTTAELTNPAISGPNADADRDGLPTLAEYASWTDPKDAGSRRHPTAGHVDIAGSSYLTFTFTRVPGITDLLYEVETSSDLVHWQTGETVPVSVNANGDGTESVVVRDTIAVGTGRRFARLKVIQQSP